MVFTQIKFWIEKIFLENFQLKCDVEWAKMAAYIVAIYQLKMLNNRKLCRQNGVFHWKDGRNLLKNKSVISGGWRVEINIRKRSNLENIMQTNLQIREKKPNEMNMK